VDGSSHIGNGLYWASISIPWRAELRAAFADCLGDDDNNDDDDDIPDDDNMPALPFK
jgi:hypothetical protein